MRLLPASITGLFKRKEIPRSMSMVPTAGTGFMGLIRESFTGAWQQGVTVDSPKSLLSFSAVYACVTLISGDISKLRIKLMSQDDDGVWTEVEGGPEGAAFRPVLKKPNLYQTRIQFLQAWVTSKLLWGNTYVLKLRDNRNIVTELYVLDPSRVMVLVADNGEVFYQLAVDNLSTLKEPVTVPASEIIHDRMNPLWHPLVGVSPLTACSTAATVGNKIQAHGAKFFENMSRPSGVLTAPGTISDATAERLKKYWEDNFSANNLGRLAVLGDGLAYAAMTIPANDAQLIQQLGFTVEDVARAFHVPLYKLQTGTPAGANPAIVNQSYYSDTLQIHIEALEVCMDEGLALPDNFACELDIETLMRMDQASRYTIHTQAIGGGWMAPNEARKKENLPPVKGGETCYLQQQNYALSALADRDKNNPLTPQPAPAAADPMAALLGGGPPAEPMPDAGGGDVKPATDEEIGALADEAAKEIGKTFSDKETKELLDYISRSLNVATSRETFEARQ